MKHVIECKICCYLQNPLFCLGKKFAIVMLVLQVKVGWGPAPPPFCTMLASCQCVCICSDAYAAIVDVSIMEHLRYADGKRIVSVGTVNLAKNIFIGCSD